MRPIKFRGRTPRGTFVEGDLEFLDDHTVVAIRDKHRLLYEIDPESIAQLVGCDANGREVYEGDTLIGAGGDEWTAELVHAPVSDDGFQHIIAPEEFTLKED